MVKIRNHGHDPHKDRKGDAKASPIYFQDVAALATYVGQVHTNMVAKGAPSLYAARWIITRMATVARSYMQKTAAITVAAKLVEEGLDRGAWSENFKP